MIDNIPGGRRLLYGAAIGASLPYVLQGGVGLAAYAKVASVAQAIIASLSDPVTVKSQVGFSTYLLWGILGASTAFLMGNIAQADSRDRAAYIITATALTSALMVAAASSFASALMTFFLMTTMGYAIHKDLDSVGFFSFQPKIPRCKIDDLPGIGLVTKKIQDAINLRDGKAVRLLLKGPAGTGKSSIAHGVAEALGKRVMIVHAADLHAGDPMDRARRIHLLFQMAAIQNCVVLLEEFEVVGRHRSGAVRDARSDEVNIIMQVLDDLKEGMSNLVIIATTNYPNSLDPAVVRSGRFDAEIEVSLPAKEQRREIVQHYKKKTNYGALGVDSLVERTEGWSGADIEAFVARAAVKPEDFEVYFQEIQGRIERQKAMVAPQVQGRATEEVEEGVPQKERIQALLNQVVSILGFQPIHLIQPEA